MIKRLAGCLLVFCSVAFGQPEPVPLRVTRILGISTTTVVDNRNAVTRQNDMHTFCATGSGTWSVKIQYSNTSSSGPWTDFPNTFSTVSDASSACTGLAYGNYSWLRFLVTGTASAVYAGVKQFYIPTEFLSSGTVLASLNGLTGTSQTFATGTSGSDFGISSATSTHTFNLPTASGSVRGALSSADWTTFNSKQAALTNSAGLRGALSDETGSGLAVFNTGPALDLPQFNVYSIGGTLPAAGTANRLALVTNASTADDCTIGGGSTWVLCVDTGSTWVHPGGGGAGAAISSLNGLTGATQTFSTGATGTDFGISSSGTAHTFNLPSASAANRGLLTSADWSTFNGKGDVSTGGSYSNPSWITALAWSKITGAPLTATTNGARVGSNDGIYLEPANPAIGFNAYYDSGWKFGNASPNNYASIITRDASGNLVFSVSSATGATGASPSFNSMTFSQSTRKLSGVTPGTAAGEVVALNGSNQVDLSLIPTCSQAEAEAGTATTCLSTAERVAQAIAALSVFKNAGEGISCVSGVCGANWSEILRYSASAGPPVGTPSASDRLIFDTTNGDIYAPLLGLWVALGRKAHTHAAADIASGDKAGTDSKLVTAAAKGTTGNCAQWTANGLGDAGAACGSGGGSSPLLISNVSDNSRTSSGDFTSSGTVTSATLNATGKIVKFRVAGYVNLGAAGQPSLSLKFGSTTVVPATTFNYSSVTGANHHFVFEGSVTVRTAGASGATWGSAFVIASDNNAAQNNYPGIKGNAASTVTLDTTVGHNFVVAVASLPGSSTIVIKAVEVYGY